MLELARWHIRHIPDVLYLYDVWNWQAPPAEQLAALAAHVRRIRARPELPALERAPW